MTTSSRERLAGYAPAVLRLGLAAVYAWFGVSQLTNPNAWTGLVPGWATALSGLNTLTIVHLNGWFELLAALAIGIGVYVRPIAALLFLHLVVITTHLGLNAIGVRDFGLSISTLAVALFDTDRYCFSFKETTTE